MKDLKKDLELIENATAGPWIARSWSVPSDDQFHIQQDIEENPKEIATAWQGEMYPGMPEISPEEAKNNAVFIAEAKEGWKHAIERALEAEAQLEVSFKLMDAWIEVVEEKKKEIERLKLELKRIDDALNSWAK